MSKIACLNVPFEMLLFSFAKYKMFVNADKNNFRPAIQITKP